MRKKEKDIKIRARILLTFGGITGLLILILGIINVAVSMKRINQMSMDNLKMSMNQAIQITDLFINTEIRTHLEQRAKTVRDVTEYYYSEYRAGRISENQARERVRNLILNKKFGKIGKTGYLCGVSGKGILEIHPFSPNMDASGFDFMKRATAMKNGYIEYEWKNKGETQARLKSGGMAYFAPWDLIIWASSYRDEFYDIIDMKKLSDLINSVKIGDSGYVYITDNEGVVLIHPVSNMIGTNLSLTPDADGKFFFQEMLSNKNHIVYYRWQNPGEKKPRHKIAYYQRVPELNWIVASSAYVSELREISRKQNLLNIVALILSIGISIGASIWLSNNIVRLAESVSHTLAGFSSDSQIADLSRSITVKSQDEMGDIVKNLNALIGRLNRDLGLLQKANSSLNITSNEMYSLLEHQITPHINIIKENIKDIDSITEQHSSASVQLNATIEEVNRNIASITNHIGKQAAAVEESASSIEEMTRSIDNAFRTANQTFDISQNLNSVANEGGVSVRESITSIREVAEYSQQILKMLKLITDISKQTNLLAMNASIEAAHAGEAGKGFAIVADEIRRLAESTNKNAKDIGEVVNSIVSKIELSVKLAEKAGLGLETILSSSQQNVDIITQLKTAMEEQKHSAQEVLTSTQEIVNITEEVKTAMFEQKISTEEIFRSVQHLKQLSVESKNSVGIHIDSLNVLIESIDAMNRIAQTNHELSGQLNNLLERFKLSDPGTEESESTSMKLVE